MDFLLKMAEQKIAEAMENGEFDDLPGKGKPLDLDDLRDVPPELRLEYKILKNAGLVPEEMTVKTEIAALEELLEKCRDQDEKAVLRRKIAERTIHYNLMLEKKRNKP